MPTFLSFAAVLWLLTAPAWAQDTYGSGTYGPTTAAVVATIAHDQNATESVVAGGATNARTITVSNTGDLGSSYDATLTVAGQPSNCASVSVTDATVSGVDATPTDDTFAWNIDASGCAALEASADATLRITCDGGNACTNSPLDIVVGISVTDTGADFVCGGYNFGVLPVGPNGADLSDATCPTAPTTSNGPIAVSTQGDVDTYIGSSGGDGFDITVTGGPYTSPGFNCDNCIVNATGVTFNGRNTVTAQQSQWNGGIVNGLCDWPPGTGPPNDVVFDGIWCEHNGSPNDGTEYSQSTASRIAFLNSTIKVFVGGASSCCWASYMLVVGGIGAPTWAAQNFFFGNVLIEGDAHVSRWQDSDNFILHNSFVKDVTDFGGEPHLRVNRGMNDFWITGNYFMGGGGGGESSTNGLVEGNTWYHDFQGGSNWSGWCNEGGNTNFWIQNNDHPCYAGGTCSNLGTEADIGECSGSGNLRTDWTGYPATVLETDFGSTEQGET